MKSLLKNLFRSRAPKVRKVRKSDRRAYLSIERLEQRDVPTAGISWNAAAGLINVEGTGGIDKVQVSYQDQGATVKVNLSQWISNPYTLSGFYVTLDEKAFAANAVKTVQFTGLEGNDWFKNDTAVKSIVYGGIGNDTLEGGSSDDIFYGNAGADVLKGNGGNDTLYGYEIVLLNGSSTGPDGGNTIYGGFGADVIFGGPQNDNLYGDAGNDKIYGYAGTDSIFGGDDNDLIKGGTGGDSLHGDAGNDVLHGESGDDGIHGGSGDDSLFAGSGYDYLFGDEGKDTLVSIDSAFEDDWLYGGSGVNSDVGADNFWMNANDHAYATSAEQVHGVHAVDAFYSYSYNGGQSSTAVSLDLSGQNLADPLPLASGLQIGNFKDKSLFGPLGPQNTDINQGDVADCYFLSPLAAIARTNPDRIRQLVADLGDGTYAVHFHDQSGKDVIVRVDADLWVNGSGTPVYAGLGQQNSLWVPIMEKAWAFYAKQMGNYANIYGGFSPDIGVDTALDITKEPSGTEKYADGAAFLSAIKQALEAGKAVTFGAPAGFSNMTPMQFDDPTTTNKNESTWRRGQHAYMVDSVLTDANGNPTGIKLYDPYGQYQIITDLDVLWFCSIGFATWDV